jgi:hypothetical protein
MTASFDGSFTPASAGIADVAATDGNRRRRRGRDVDAEYAEPPEVVRVAQVEAAGPQRLDPFRARVQLDALDLRGREIARLVVSRLLQQPASVRLVHRIDENDADAVRGDGVEPRLEASRQIVLDVHGAVAHEALIDEEHGRRRPCGEPRLHLFDHVIDLVERQRETAVLPEVRPHVSRGRQSDPDAARDGVGVGQVGGTYRDAVLPALPKKRTDDTGRSER